MAWRTREGVRLKGDTPEAVIADLRSRAWMPGTDLDQYIRKTARAAALQTGEPIRGDSAANLLADLVREGLVVQEN